MPFPKPGDDRKSILIFNMHPSHTFDPQMPTTPVPFAPEALYELKIDTNGDAVADIAYEIGFSPFTNGAQAATLRYVAGAQTAGTSDDGQVIVEGAPTSGFGGLAEFLEVGEYRFFAGWRSDTFFDPLGAVNSLHFTEQFDFFAEKNVCSIVLEVPNSALGPKEVGLWMRTLDGAGGWVQADRGALPSRDLYFFRARREMLISRESLQTTHVSWRHLHIRWSTLAGTRRRQRGATKTLLPDIMRYDHRRPASYPDNGRTLTDRALDHFLSILTNGKITNGQHGSAVAATSSPSFHIWADAQIG